MFANVITTLFYFYFLKRTLLCTEVLPWDRDLREGAKGWARVQTKGGPEVGGWKLWHSLLWQSENIPVESHGISGNIKTGPGRSWCSNTMTIFQFFVHCTFDFFLGKYEFRILSCISWRKSTWIEIYWMQITKRIKKEFSLFVSYGKKIRYNFPDFLVK